MMKLSPPPRQYRFPHKGSPKVSASTSNLPRLPLLTITTPPTVSQMPRSPSRARGMMLRRKFRCVSMNSMELHCSGRGAGLSVGRCEPQLHGDRARTNINWAIPNWRYVLHEAGVAKRYKSAGRLCLGPLPHLRDGWSADSRDEHQCLLCWRCGGPSNPCLELL